MRFQASNIQILSPSQVTHASMMEAIRLAFSRSFSLFVNVVLSMLFPLPSNGTVHNFLGFCNINWAFSQPKQPENRLYICVLESILSTL